MSATNFRLITNLLFCFFLNSCVTCLAQSEPPSASTNAVPPTFEGTDLYGSNRLTLEMVKQLHGELLQKSIDEFLAGNTEAYQRNKKIFSDSLMRSESGSRRLSGNRPQYSSCCKIRSFDCRGCGYPGGLYCEGPWKIADRSLPWKMGAERGMRY